MKSSTRSLLTLCLVAAASGPARADYFGAIQYNSANGSVQTSSSPKVGMNIPGAFVYFYYDAYQTLTLPTNSGAIGGLTISGTASNFEAIHGIPISTPTSSAHMHLTFTQISTPRSLLEAYYPAGWQPSSVPLGIYNAINSGTILGSADITDTAPSFSVSLGPGAVAAAEAARQAGGYFAIGIYASGSTNSTDGSVPATPYTDATLSGLDVSVLTVVPEPSSAALAALGSLALLILNRMRGR